MVYRVNSNRCIGCEDCTEECPSEAIAMDDEIAVIDEDGCIGCALCVSVCPVDAIPYEEDEYVRSIWNRNFTIAYCESCGKAIGTAAEVVHRAHENGEDVRFLCDDCK